MKYLLPGVVITTIVFVFALLFTTGSAHAQTLTPVNQGGTGWRNFVTGTIPIGNGALRMATSSGLLFDTSRIRLTFTNGSSTAFSVSGTAYFGTATTTNLFGTSIGGFGLTSCTGTNFLQWSGNVFACAAGAAGSSSKWATTTDSTVITPNGGATIGISIQAASSTIRGINSTTASTSAGTSSVSFYLPYLKLPAGQVLATDPNGLVIGTTTAAGGVTSVTGTYPIICSGTTGVTCSTAFGTTTNNTYSGTNTFNGNVTMAQATSTSFFTTTASSTSLFSNSGTIGTFTAGTLSVSGTSAFTGLATFGNGLIMQATSSFTTLSGVTASTTNLNLSSASLCTGGNALQTNSAGTVSCGAVSATLTGGTAGMLASWTSASALTATGTPTFANFFATSSSGITGTSTILGQLTIGNAGNGGFLYPNTPLNISKSINSSLQIVTTNTSNGAGASADYIAGNDISNDNAYYADLGCNSSGYNTAAYATTWANDCYLYANDGNLVISAASSTKQIKFTVGGTGTSSLLMTLANGMIGVGTTSPNYGLVISSSTAPQFSLTNGAGAPGWAMRAMSNMFAIATTTGGFGNATSSNNVLTINQNGFIGVSTSTPGSIFSIGGLANLTYASTTFYSTGGINIINGCFAVNNVCLTASTNYWTTSGSFLYNNTGTYVGIGTTTPNAVLTTSVITNVTDSPFLTWGPVVQLTTTVSTTTYSANATYTKSTGLVSLVMYVTGGGGGGGGGRTTGGAVKGGNGGTGATSTMTYNSGATTVSGGAGVGGKGAGNSGVTCVGGTATNGDTNSSGGTCSTTSGGTSGSGGFAVGSAGSTGTTAGGAPGGGGGGSPDAGGTLTGDGGGGGARATKTLTASQVGATETVTVGGGGGGGACESAATAPAAGGNGATNGVGGTGAAFVGGCTAGGGNGGNGNTNGSQAQGGSSIAGSGGAGGSVVIVETIQVTATSSSVGFKMGFLTTPSLNGQSTTTQAAGIGTTTPSGIFAIQAVWGATAQIVAQVIGGVNYTTEMIDRYAHLITGGPAPTCGAGCSSVAGDDRTMRVLSGSAVSSITVNFANTYTTSPACFTTQLTGFVGGANASSTPTTVVITPSAAVTTKYFDVICQNSAKFTY